MKTKKSRIALSGVSVLLVLSLLVGGTMAWFTDTEKVDANFSAGVLDIIAEPGVAGKATLEFENLRPLTVDQFNAELVQEDLSNQNQEGFAPAPVYFQPVKITNNGTLPVYIQITAESMPDDFICPKRGEKNILFDNDDKTVSWDGTRVACTNGLEDKLKIFVYALDASGNWKRVEGINLNEASLGTDEKAVFTPGKEHFLPASGTTDSVTYVIGGYLPQDVGNRYQGKHFHGNIVVNAYQTDEGAGMPEEPTAVDNTINVSFKENGAAVGDGVYSFTANSNSTKYKLSPEDLAAIVPEPYKVTGLQAADGTVITSIPLVNGKVVDTNYTSITAIVEKITYAYTIHNKVNGMPTDLGNITGFAPAGEMEWFPPEIKHDGKTYVSATGEAGVKYEISNDPEKNVFEANYVGTIPENVTIDVVYREAGTNARVGSNVVNITMVEGEEKEWTTDMTEVIANLPTFPKCEFANEQLPAEKRSFHYPNSFKDDEGTLMATVTFLVNKV